MLTTFNTDDYVLRALKAGARGFLLKDTSPAEMLDAIRRAAAGEPVLSPQVAGQGIAAATAQERVDTAAKQNLDSLTTRERDVARLLAEGKSNQDIAHELYMSLATVKANITRIFLKLEVDNRVAAAMRIRDGGGIPKD
ncbi:MAG: response regulator transcription factor [Propionibacterium sp.]|nr:response regulator transcription factor [Propionibacterium sp.]